MKRAVVKEPELPLKETPVTEPEVVENVNGSEGAEETTGSELSTQVEVGSLMTAPVGSLIGQLDAGDYGVARLKLMQTNTPLVIESRGDYLPGDWVLNGSDILWREGCEAINLTILKFQKKFVQQTKFGDDLGQIFDTAEEARAAGLIPFGGDGVGFVAFGVAVILIKQGDGIESSAFTEEFEDGLYAMSLWQLTGMSYKTVMQKLSVQSRNGRLKSGLHVASFNLEARLEKGKVSSYWTPVFTDGPENGPEFIKFAEFCGT
jgi:hypothetical protein